MQLEKKITGASIRQGHILIEWDDGSQQACLNQWLRDNCPTARPGGPGTQRHLELTGIPPQIRPESAEPDKEGNLMVTWSDGGHKSLYPAWYPGFLLKKPAMSRDYSPVYWGKQNPPETRRFYWESLRASPAVQREFLESIVRQGFALVHQLPPREDFLFKVVDLFGYIRETNYGRSFHVRDQPDPDNLAFTLSIFLLSNM